MIRKIFWSSYTIVGIVTALLGLFVGFIINDLPKVEFENKLKLYEVLNLFLTFCVAFSIPFIVKKSIDDTRAIKALVSDDIRELIKDLKKINTIIRDCFNKSTIESEDKESIIKSCNALELEINSLHEQLTISFKTQAKNFSEEINSAYFKYDRYVTGEELMDGSKLNEDFYNGYKLVYSKLELQLKKTIHKVHGL